MCLRLLCLGLFGFSVFASRKQARRVEGYLHSNQSLGQRPLANKTGGWLSTRKWASTHFTQQLDQVSCVHGRRGKKRARSRHRAVSRYATARLRGAAATRSLWFVIDARWGEKGHPRRIPKSATVLKGRSQLFQRHLGSCCCGRGLCVSARCRAV